MADTFDDFPSDDTPPEEGNNRTFLIVAGILGGIILITAACLGGVLLLNRGNNNAAPDPALLTATAQAQNNVINDALTATFQASILPTTTLTPAPTSTAVVALPSATPTTDPALANNAPLTATIAAALTQAAAAQLTIVPTTTAVPNTGFFDDYGFPGLFVMAIAFVIVILLARRLRVSPVTNR